MKTIKDIMTREVDYCTILDNSYEAALKMKEKDVGVIPVVNESGAIEGIITDRDIAIRGVASKRPGSSRITEIMTKNVITATPDMTVEEAEELMSEAQIRRLPVIDNGKLAGIVALKDLAVHRETDLAAGMALKAISEDRGEIQQ
ncbi:CBS domain-containing protein [Bacillus massiliglaciei]|uniref:CBS domain-containing protein n=1 Tax=Bacillus massiliglaciei TaxID=1816693 RepID=UPI000DA605C5|nr:CBS domain-containing protein [Bacillus massiliglaciei]